MSDYELQRERNILANKALLAQLGLEKPAPPIKPLLKKRKAQSDPSTVRKSARVANQRDRTHSPAPSSSSSSEDEYTPRNRRSKRRIPFIDSETAEGDAASLRRRIVNGRCVQHISRSHVRPDPKVHGAIPGIRVGKWWPTRLACSADSVHPPPVSGIYGSGSTGAFSVALSGGYEDDIDEGFRFTYTGSGGRDLKGTVNKPKNLRTAPQSCDQTLTGGNLALKTSCDTGMPVRVIRGYKAELGPSEGYRYDGLYRVLKAWEDMGLAGFKVWRFAFKRVDGQAPIKFDAGPMESGDEEEEEEEEEEDVKEEEEDEVEEKYEVEEEVKSEVDTAVKEDIASEDSADELAASRLKGRKVKTKPRVEIRAIVKTEIKTEVKTEVKIETKTEAPKKTKGPAPKVKKAAEPQIRRNTRQRI